MGMRPRYNALMPPSSRTTFNVIPHTVRSAFEKAVATGFAADAVADVWYADVSAGRPDDVVRGAEDCIGMDAVTIDNLDRTRSNGYVVPAGRIRSEWPECR